jgi:hypothetical protein
MLNTLLMTSWLCLPMAPLNPVEEDTLSSISLHVAVGATNPTGILTAGPLLAARYEVLALHRFMVRGTIDVKYGRVTSGQFPNGHLYSTMIGVDAIYYRGTNHLTAYMGMGPVIAMHHFKWFDETADSLFAAEQVTDLDVQTQFGYRLTFGLRYHTRYSLELALVELHPDFLKVGVSPDGRQTRRYEKTRTGSFSITFGYLFEI